MNYNKKLKDGKTQKMHFKNDFKCIQKIYYKCI
jgi:hypothetical protein